MEFVIETQREIEKVSVRGYLKATICMHSTAYGVIASLKLVHIYLKLSPLAAIILIL